MAVVWIRVRPTAELLLAGREYPLFLPGPDQDPQLGPDPLLLAGVIHHIFPRQQRATLPSPALAKVERPPWNCGASDFGWAEFTPNPISLGPTVNARPPLNLA